VLELPSEVHCVAFSPDRPLLACGDESGVLHRVELVGVRYGPLVVTAVDRGGGPHVRCPACGTIHPLDESWRRSVIACPTCCRELRVNAFVVESPPISVFL
jgi:hypothetical protein